MAALKGTPKGAAFDRTYLEQEIGIHKAVLDVAQGHDAAQNPELKRLIEQAKPVIEKHLNQAEEIQKKLGKPTRESVVSRQSSVISRLARLADS
jgi:predicted outer membrane protein